MTAVAIIAALESELQPLVKAWKKNTLIVDGKAVECHESEGAIAVAGGIGSRRAEAVARAVVEAFHPQVLVSAGLAGALIPSLKVGAVVLPNVIVDAETGVEYRCDVGGDIVGGGILVTAPEVAGAESKRRLVERFHALTVDMEAAGVARVAQQKGAAFRCVKAISDEADFVMPPLSRFVAADGQFEQGKFVRWLALRPQHWAKAFALGRNSGRASRALCDWLRQNMAAKLQPARVVTLREAECSKN
ncbi:MAG TPA: phosphorylase [Candidatus Angelobacter sp.]